MNSTEHLSQQTLELLVKNELSQSDRTSSRLHLSYCTACRSRRDELTLKLVAEKMWATYPLARDQAHIDDGTLKRFWRGELTDDSVLKAISHHCVACTQCRDRRQIVQSKLETVEETKRSILLTLLLTGISIAWQNRRITGMVVLALALVTALIVTFSVRRPVHRIATPPAASEKQATGAPEEKRPIGTPGLEDKESLPPSQPEHRPPKEMLAHVQTIDLTRVPPDGDDSRSPDVQADTKPDFTVVVSRARSTLLRIALPFDSKKGVYRVSIRDQAFLDEIARARGVSRNGKILTLFVDFGRIENGTYVLRLEREAGRYGNVEYVGDYEFALTRAGSK